MATKYSREHANPLKKKFVSPNANRKSPKFISPKFKASLKEFHKSTQQGKKDASLKKKLYEWKKEKREKYHLGGTSSDPLNLNSLINRDPALSTPQASPHPTHGDSPIDVCYPPHEDDPLNLKCNPDDDLKDGVTPKKKKKKKHKNNHNDIENKVGKDHNKDNECDDQPAKEKKKKKKHKKTKDNAFSRQESVSDSSVVSEDVKQPKKAKEQTEKVQSVCSEKSQVSDDSESEPPEKRRRKISDTSIEEKNPEVPLESEKIVDVVEKSCNEQPSPTTSKQQEHADFKKPKNKKSSKVFIYGNYNRYYNYRNPHFAEDLRVKAFCSEWFAGKDVLDIGCNVGDVTIYIAKNFEPRIIIGNDIDNALIKIAKSKCQSYAQSSNNITSNFGKMKFPMSFAITNGPIALPSLVAKEENLKFPKNIIFKQVRNLLIIIINYYIVWY